MSLIQTFNTSLVDLNINSETDPRNSHDNVIDFLEVFNLLNSQDEKVDEEKFNQESLVSQQILAFHSKMIEIHENLDLEDNTISIPQVLYIAENSLEITDEDNYNDFNNTIECITLKVSSQPWIFSPNHKVSSENLLEAVKFINNTPNIQTYNVHITHNPETYNALEISEIEKLEINDKLHITHNPETYNALEISEVEKQEVVLETSEEIHPALLHINTSDYIINEYIKYDCSFSPDLSIKKYEALSNAVHNQVCAQVKMHNFNLADSIEIELYPEKLGRVKIRCDIDSNDKIILQVSTEKLTTLALLQHNALELKETIAKNFNDYHQDKTELSFSMSDDRNDHKQNANNSHQQFPVSDIKTNTIVYFLHNGIINLVV